MFGYDLGVDLGSNSIVISVPSKGVVINEPSFVAYDSEKEKIIYAGRRAYYLQGREPKGIEIIQPVANGAITNYSVAQKLVKFYVEKVVGKSFFKPRVLASISATATDVERRTLISVFISAGARSVCLVEEPLCAAFGAGVDPMLPSGVFVIDIGAGTTDMAVISQGSISQNETIKIAGNRFDEEIARYLKDEYNLLIGKKTAEDVKNSIAAAVPREEDVFMQVRGRNSVTGLPDSVEVTGNEICECLTPLFTTLSDTARAMFERTSPQLVADITNDSVILTGGCSAIYGIDELFKQAIGAEVTIAPRAELCVAKGTIVALNKMHILDEYGYRFQTKQDVRMR